MGGCFVFGRLCRFCLRRASGDLLAQEHVCRYGCAILAFCQNGMPREPAAPLIPCGLFVAYYLRREAGETAHRLNETRWSLTASTTTRSPIEDGDRNSQTSQSLLARFRSRKAKTQ